jgi:hypothetical protein
MIYYLMNRDSRVFSAGTPPAGQQLSPSHYPLAGAILLLIKSKETATTFPSLILRPNVLHSRAVIRVTSDTVRLVRILSQVLSTVLQFDFGVFVRLRVAKCFREAVSVRTWLLRKGLLVAVAGGARD